mgnify:FL=1
MSYRSDIWVAATMCLRGGTDMALDYRATNDVELVSFEELSESVAATVRRLGWSKEELAEQARRGEFVSERARLAWGLIRDLERVRSR